MVPTTAQAYYDYNNGTKNCTSILKLQYWYKMHKYTKITIVAPTTVLCKHIKITILVPKNTGQESTIKLLHIMAPTNAHKVY
jgi:hypothetical protein